MPTFQPIAALKVAEDNIADKLVKCCSIYVIGPSSEMISSTFSAKSYATGIQLAIHNYSSIRPAVQYHFRGKKTLVGEKHKHKRLPLPPLPLLAKVKDEAGFEAMFLYCSMDIPNVIGDRN